MLDPGDPGPVKAGDVPGWLSRDSSPLARPRPRCCAGRVGAGVSSYAANGSAPNGLPGGGMRLAGEAAAFAGRAGAPVPRPGAWPGSSAYPGAGAGLAAGPSVGGLDRAVAVVDHLMRWPGCRLHVPTRRGGHDGARHMIEEGVLEAAGQPLAAAYAVHVLSAWPRGSLRDQARADPGRGGRA